MLATEVDKAKRKLQDTETNYLYVPWSSATVRFSEKLQIIDVQDCLSVVYESHGSAKTAQTKYFASDLQTTEKALECETGKLMMKVKWSDAARVRVAVGVPFMHKFFDKICKMARAADMASKLNVDTLTVRAACQEDVAEEEEEGGKTDGKTDTRMVVTDAVFKLADPRVAAQAATRRLSADVAESIAREGRAGHQARMDDIDYQEKRQISSAKTSSAQFQAFVACTGEGLKLLKQKLEIAESVGMHDKAAALKRKLSEILDV